MNEIQEMLEREFLNKEGFIKDNKIKIDYISPNNAQVSMPIETRHLNPSNIVHGGIIYALADSAMGILARSEGRNVVTVSAQINYLRPAKTQILKAHVKCNKSGKNIAFYETEILDENETVLAICTGTFYYIDNRQF